MYLFIFVLILHDYVSFYIFTLEVFSGLRAVCPLSGESKLFLRKPIPGPVENCGLGLASTTPWCGPSRLWVWVSGCDWFNLSWYFLVQVNQVKVWKELLRSVEETQHLIDIRSKKCIKLWQMAPTIRIQCKGFTRTADQCQAKVKTKPPSTVFEC